MNGECIRSYGKLGNKPLNLYKPCGIAVSPMTGCIYIADFSNNCIQVLYPDLTFSIHLLQKNYLRDSSVIYKTLPLIDKVFCMWLIPTIIASRCSLLMKNCILYLELKDQVVDNSIFHLGL